MKRNCIVFLLAAMLSTWHAGTVVGAPIYHLTPLEFFPGKTFSWAYGINSSGQVVGAADPHMFLWTRSGGMQDFLGAPGIATAIGDDGTIVGSTSLGDPNGAFRAFRWTASGGMQTLGTLGINSRATAISRDGTIVGWFEQQGGFDEPFIWTVSGGMKQLGSVLNADAYGINLSGQVVGASASGLYVPYVWDAKTGAVQNIGTLGPKQASPDCEFCHSSRRGVQAGQPLAG
jgi:uncharacterized membrane protein